MFRAERHHSPVRAPVRLIEPVLHYNRIREPAQQRLIPLLDAHAGKPMGLKELRKQADLTQVELAKRTGIARTIISSYETGRRDVRNMTHENA